MLQVPHLARLTDFIYTCMFRSCVEWESTNTRIKTRSRCERTNSWCQCPSTTSCSDLSFVDNLSRTLHKQSLSAVQAQTIADLTVKTLMACEQTRHLISFSSLSQLSDKTNCHFQGRERHQSTLKLVMEIVTVAL